MKKLRMIVTSVVVLAIVGGAFAFKTKIGRYCVRIATTDPSDIGGDCTAVKTDFKFTDVAHAGTQYYIYPTWDGVAADCTPIFNGNCRVKIKLTTD